MHGRGADLSATAVSKSYRGKRVLEAVNLQVAPGESVAIVGENGSGKSTFISICAGVIRANSGKVVSAERLGYCPQTPGLAERLTASEHMQLLSTGVADPREGCLRTRELLDRLGLNVDNRTIAAELSGGQRQKLNLGLAVLNDPQLLLLDEPYQGFDHGTYLDFWAEIERWTNQGRSVVVVTHLLPEVRYVDRVLTMKDGVLA